MVAVWATATVPAIVVRRNHRHTRDASVLLRHCRHYFFVQCNDVHFGRGRRRCPGLGPGESRRAHEPASAAAVVEEAPGHRQGREGGGGRSPLLLLPPTKGPHGGDSGGGGASMVGREESPQTVGR